MVAINAGLLADPTILVDVPKLITAYYQPQPDTLSPHEKVIFGTSGHRGSSLINTFNEWHILAITQAICLYRKHHKITGPLYLGFDTHALSKVANLSALEVLVANDVLIMVADNDEYTPTPAISHAILNYNRNRESGFADGIVITPSHNPPGDGGFKYNPPHGGPAEPKVTKWIENQANEFLKAKLKDVKRSTITNAANIKTHDYLNNYVDELSSIIDTDLIKSAKISIGVDPMGGAGVHYWQAIADRYHINLTVVNKIVDPTFKFMTLDWDGQIRMDPSSIYAMQNLIKLKNDFDIAIACDTDHDRHGIVTKSVGLMSPNHYLSTAIFYLFQHRPLWLEKYKIGKSLVTSDMLNRVAKKLNQKIYETPVGFMWFVNGLLNAKLAIGCEESAGCSFLKFNGEAWSTDKDGITAALLAAEITAKLGKDPGVIYKELQQELGVSHYIRIDAPATPDEKSLLKTLTNADIKIKTLAGEPIKDIRTRAAGDDEPIGGIKVTTENGWFAARPSGTENIYKIYAESFIDETHLNNIVIEAKKIVNTCITSKNGDLK